ncbi:hypothetical protein BS47DRAFT_1395146 [Hydnum rufescens UP504]|uniref:Uncharacterized protein n=1 Tax=Hydnum rufescens UP504 TaxID=1448309 RepID=A0A9P6AT11_9AGAM|nr:hypothetical protein BS47DRAFT_1395146 [Hydnum rufescens UP504]
MPTHKVYVLADSPLALAPHIVKLSRPRPIRGAPLLKIPTRLVALKLKLMTVCDGRVSRCDSQLHFSTSAHSSDEGLMWNIGRGYHSPVKTQSLGKRLGHNNTLCMKRNAPSTFPALMMKMFHECLSASHRCFFRKSRLLIRHAYSTAQSPGLTRHWNSSTKRAKSRHVHQLRTITWRALYTREQQQRILEAIVSRSQEPGARAD